MEWHPGERYPRVGFIVTNLGRPARKVVTPGSERAIGRLPLHNLANFLNTLVLPGEIAP